MTGRIRGAAGQDGRVGPDRAGAGLHPLARPRRPATGPIHAKPGRARARAGGGLVAVGAGMCATAIALGRDRGFGARTSLEPCGRAHTRPSARPSLLPPAADRSRAAARGGGRRGIRGAAGPVPNGRGGRADPRGAHPGARGGTPAEARGTWTRWPPGCARHRDRQVRLRARTGAASPRLTSLTRCAAAQSRAGACAGWPRRRVRGWRRARRPRPTRSTGRRPPVVDSSRPHFRRGRTRLVRRWPRPAALPRSRWRSACSGLGRDDRHRPQGRAGRAARRRGSGATTSASRWAARPASW